MKVWDSGNEGYANRGFSRIGDEALIAAERLMMPRWRRMMPIIAIGVIVATISGCQGNDPLVSGNPTEDSDVLKRIVTPTPNPSSLSLKHVPVPEPPNLKDFIWNKQAAIRLGKALFWDMQVGNDKIQACGSCHFAAGADSRTKNQINPGTAGNDSTFQLGGPNYTLKPEDFPLYRLSDLNDPNSPVVNDYTDVVSSQGVFNDFYPVDPNNPDPPDSVFHVQNVNTRRVEGRNAPTVINAVFNYANFWDGRANFYFNGVTVFGPLDENSGIYVNNKGQLEKRLIRIPFSSLASQAVGPPVSDQEMGAHGLTFPTVGRKMVNFHFHSLGRRLLTLRPLAKQMVHPQDSVLGPLSRAKKRSGRLTGNPGLNTTYAVMIAAAFRPEYWSSTQIIQVNDDTACVINRPHRSLADNEFTQMEFNFSFFFGLAIQMYESTLVADDTPFDRFQDGDTNALSAQQQEGMDIFLTDVGRCTHCHVGPELTGAAVNQLTPKGVLIMTMTVGSALYDFGIWNTGVQRTVDDPGRAGAAPFTNPLTGQPYPLSFTRQALLKRDNLLPPGVAPYVTFALPTGDPVPPDRDATHGTFKTPQLRNVELTAPLMHNGSMATLRQAVDFYNRGGNFGKENVDDFNLNIRMLHLTPTQKDSVVAFLIGLTDERVRQEKAPFDHPQLFVPNGLIGDENHVSCSTTLRPNGFRENEEVLEIPAVGAAGRPAEGLPPLGHFLDLDPFTP